MDLAPVLEQLAQNAKVQAQSSENEGTFREEVAMQMLLIQERLSELALPRGPCCSTTPRQREGDGGLEPDQGGPGVAQGPAITRAKAAVQGLTASRGGVCPGMKLRVFVVAFVVSAWLGCQCGPGTASRVRA